MSENDERPKILGEQQETAFPLNRNDNGRMRMDTQVGNTQEASSLNNEPRFDHPSDISNKVDALSLSETNEYTEFMHKLSTIESRKTGNDALDRNRVRRPREKLFQEFFRTHKNLHSHLAIRIAAENKSFRDALLTKRMEQVIENNPFLIGSHAPQTKDGWTIDKALIKIREFELLLKEIQQLETPEIPLEEIKLSEHSLKRVRDMRYNLREKLREVDPEGVRQWIIVTADAEAPARIEAAKKKKKETIATHQAETAQNEAVQQTVPTAENIVSSTQEVRNLMHTLGRETTTDSLNRVTQISERGEQEHPTSEQDGNVSYQADTDSRHKLAQASRSNLSARLKEGPADPLSSFGDLNQNSQQSSGQDVRESLKKLSAPHLTARLEQGPQEPLQTVGSTSVSDEGKMGEELRRRLSSVSASHLTQRLGLEQGTQSSREETSELHQAAAPSQSVREEGSHPTTAVARDSEKERIDRERANIPTVVSAMWNSNNPDNVAQDARAKGNNGIAGFVRSTVSKIVAEAIENNNAQRNARISSTTGQRAQTSKQGGFLKRLLGLGR
ncbi:MAG: hypothetical protein KatS3mg083_385 [Candidatus Dojkabacteria bacterium]|nr:MAG: hypothetical protein KatS3mg083_385 [Candidatus Dojkabacteria bacterium]